MNPDNSLPLVSVVIPCYNVQDYVTNALDSVIGQKHPLVEIICVDDGSTDHTLDVLQRWKDDHPEVTISILQQENQGACAARNNGIRNANGKYIQFLDADDVVYPDKIQHQVALFKTNPDAAFIGASYIKKAVNGDINEVRIGPPGMLSVFKGEAGITSANFFRTDTLLEVNGWRSDLSSSQEADLMLRIMLSGNGYISDTEVLTEIRERRSGQISQGNPNQRIANYLTVRGGFIKAIQNKMPQEWELNKQLYQSFIVSTLLIGEKYQPGMWESYRPLLPKPSELVSIAGLGKKAIWIARLFGYSFLFRLQGLRNEK